MHRSWSRHKKFFNSITDSKNNPWSTASQNRLCATRCLVNTIQQQLLRLMCTPTTSPMTKPTVHTRHQEAPQLNMSLSLHSIATGLSGNKGVQIQFCRLFFEFCQLKFVNSKGPPKRYWCFHFAVRDIDARLQQIRRFAEYYVAKSL